MRSQWKRLVLAAGLSLGCGVATMLWYYGTAKKISNSGEVPLAQVATVGDEVLRRPATRLLWEQVNTGDNLYNGETIRTSALGELRIQFEDGRYIDLEPDSLIVLQKMKGEISLDLMEGSLFVNAKSGEPAAGAKGEAAPGLVLNSKNGKVDLNGSSASLSKGNGDRVNMQVLEGKAKVRGSDGREKEIGIGSTSSIGDTGLQMENTNLVILEPAPNKTLYIDPDQENPILFKWRGYPAAWNVAVMAGATRKDLHEIAQTAKPGDSQILTKLPIGKHWWRLVAKDPATGKTMNESQVTRLDVQARYAPTVIFPLADAEIPMEKSPYDLTFKWQQAEEVSKVQLEVSQNPSLKPLLANKAFKDADHLTLPALKEGTYYWRMSSFFEGADHPVVGKVQKFALVKHLSPKKDPVQISWAIPADQMIQNFGSDPKIDLSWKPKNRKEDIAGYYVRLSNENDKTTEPQKIESRDTHLNAKIPRAGRYIASVDAYDKDGTIIGSSEPVTIAANEVPALGAPTLLPPTGVLQTRMDGRTEVHWEELPGAASYQLTIIDQTGKELAKKSYTTNTANLKNLMPGQYTVHLEAVDAFGRPGKEGTARTLVVPDSSGLQAPKMKKIKVN